MCIYKLLYLFFIVTFFYVNLKTYVRKKRKWDVAATDPATAPTTDNNTTSAPSNGPPVINQFDVSTAAQLAVKRLLTGTLGEGALLVRSHSNLRNNILVK